jgi:predicted PhzF superfamily epimerase YddE/YHI9
MPAPLAIVDAFTAEPFAGNPAAVCRLESWPADAWMQRVAAELRLSETAFLVPRPDGWGLRWFTPEVEVSLCGHATLASAHVLWSEAGADPAAPLVFATASGELRAVRRGGFIELDFPSRPVTRVTAPDGLAEALGAELAEVGRSADDLVVRLANEAAVRALAPDVRALRRLPVRGITVTAASADPDFDFVSRFFAPAVGVDEDPVTGSAHCALGPFWQERLGKSSFRAHQVSARGGVLAVRVEGERVVLGGRAVTVVSGVLRV